MVSQAGAVLLVETVRKSGVDAALPAALALWSKPRTVHDPGDILLDLTLATALSEDCLADIAMQRAEPALCGLVASDPTVSRPVGTLATAGSRTLTAIRRPCRTPDYLTITWLNMDTGEYEPGATTGTRRRASNPEASDRQAEERRLNQRPGCISGCG